MPKQHSQVRCASEKDASGAWPPGHARCRLHLHTRLQGTLASCRTLQRPMSHTSRRFTPAVSVLQHSPHPRLVEQLKEALCRGMPVQGGRSQACTRWVERRVAVWDHRPAAALRPGNAALPGLTNLEWILCLSVYRTDPPRPPTAAAPSSTLSISPMFTQLHFNLTVHD